MYLHEHKGKSLVTCHILYKLMRAECLDIHMEPFLANINAVNFNCNKVQYASQFNNELFH